MIGGGAYPLFKGATRPAMFLGVPLIPLMCMAISVASLALVMGLWWWSLAAPLWALMAAITRCDDRAFRKLGLWISTQGRNWLLQLLTPGAETWGGSSYSKRAFVRGECGVSAFAKAKRSKN